MSEYDQPPIELLRRHCAMFEYGSQASRSPLLSQVGEDFISFAGMHLVCTMFLTSDRRDGGAPYGVFHRILDPEGRADLLRDVDRALTLPVGDTTLGEYIRHKRNKLAVHGTLAYSSQPQEVQDVVFDEDALGQFDDAMSELEDAVRQLDTELAALESAPDAAH